MATELGATVKDKITGFKGVVTGRVEYISGCNQVLVTPSVKADGDLNDAALVRRGSRRASACPCDLFDDHFAGSRHASTDPVNDRRFTREGLPFVPNLQCRNDRRHPERVDALVKNGGLFS